MRAAVVVVALSVVVAVRPAARGIVRPLISGAPQPATAWTTARTVWDSVYTTNQAARGETAYVKQCARCHQASLSGADDAPALTGGAFLGNWNGLPLSELHKRIRTTMPSDSVGIYDRDLQGVSDVMAYVLKVNGFPAGNTDLPADNTVLHDIMIQSSRP